MSRPLRALIREATSTPRSKLINMFDWRTPRLWVAHDFDPALSGHETLVNFDLPHGSEHKTIVCARECIDKWSVRPLNHCLVQYGNITACAEIMKCFRSLRAHGYSSGWPPAPLELWPVNRSLTANEFVFGLDISLCRLWSPHPWMFRQLILAGCLLCRRFAMAEMPCETVLRMLSM